MRGSLNTIKTFSLIGLFLALTACQPAATTPGQNISGNGGGGKPNKPLNDEKVREMTSLLTAAGRFEEVARILSRQAASWGEADATTKNLAEKMKSDGCVPRFSQEFTGSGTFEKKIEFNNTKCLFVGSSVMTILPGTRQMELNSAFQVATAEGAQTAGVKSVEFNWVGQYHKMATTGMKRKEISLRGNGAVKSPNGKTFRLEIEVVRFREDETDTKIIRGGRIVITLADTASGERVAINADYNVPNSPSFELNGTAISASAFESYIQKLGWFVGKRAPDEDASALITPFYHPLPKNSL